MLLARGPYPLLDLFLLCTQLRYTLLQLMHGLDALLLLLLCLLKHEFMSLDALLSQAVFQSLEGEQQTQLSLSGKSTSRGADESNKHEVHE